ncbi:hypothetical protein NPIL_532201 [Nephila pilipes]|uniref:SCP domain-containing protein n=1 Tax=Nephila pilipes TaxID=299642 RepID=A0A8X6QFI5_NEPPI|nr:hypothetical protein NPIL_532201 [Nephila pilipes]
MGQETRGGGLPSASDMMQMVWDDELAAIAQKWANHCVYEHDCGDCRSVANFPVGQNIAYQDTICDSKQCFKNIEASDLQPDWPSVLKDFYDEIDDFDNKLVPNFQMLGGKEINHFTQMIWGKSWRLGCGLTVFTKGRLSYRRFYVCNYGKAGNVIGQPMYEQGRPGSGCPVNSCVGGANCNGNDYPGLCQMLNSNTAPVYPRSQSSKDLFYCDSSPDTDDCAVSANGTNNWGFASSLEGL